MSLEEATSISNTETTFDAQLIKKLTNTEVELKKCVAYKKSVERKQEETPLAGLFK